MITDSKNLSKAQLKRLEQWAELRRILSNIEKRRREFAKDLRSDYPPGEIGDSQFIAFVTDVMGEKHDVARMLLTLAMLAHKIPNDREYDRVIGVNEPKRATANLNIAALSKLDIRKQEEMVSKYKRGGASDLRCALNTLFRNERKASAPSVTPYQIAKLLDEHWETLEATGIPLKEFSLFINAYLKKDEDKSEA